jgi:FKBP-type peptidyl-prolyl cis-trans isomerase FklB
MGIVSSCSEDSDTEDEFDKWQEKNDAYIEKLATSSMTKYLTYSKNATISGAASTDYVYVEVLESGSGEPALFTDTVRVAYRGRLIPSPSYTDGYVFDQTFLGDFDWSTAGTTKFSPGETGLRDGFSTALQNMRVGDRWRVHFSYKLGYGTSDYSDIPGYSDLIFDIAVYDIWHPGETRPVFKSR